MSVLASTDIYFNVREDFSPILRLLFSCGWRALNIDAPNSFTWFPPGFYENYHDKEEENYKENCEENDMVILPKNQIKNVLKRIHEYDKDLSFTGILGISLVFPCPKVFFETDYPIQNRTSFNTLWTGGDFIINYSLNTPHLSCLWNFNRLLIGDQKGITDFPFYHEKLETIFQVYQDRIKKIIDETDW